MPSLYKVIFNFISDPRLKPSLLYQIRLIIDPNEEAGGITKELTTPEKEKMLDLVMSFADCIDGFVIDELSPLKSSASVDMTYEGLPDSERTDEIEVWFSGDMMRKFMKECKCWIK
tara:strand:+ start:72 stop:419 length:348 start_codon:yes stop_codon:yes gene_type:complete